MTCKWIWQWQKLPAVSFRFGCWSYLMVYIWVKYCAFKQTAWIVPLNILHKMLSADTANLFQLYVLFFCLRLTLTRSQPQISDYHPSTYDLNYTLRDLCYSGKPFISRVSQICCHVNSCPDCPRCTATQSNRSTEGINKFTFGLCTLARLQFRGSLGWRVELTIGVPHRNNLFVTNNAAL